MKLEEKLETDNIILQRPFPVTFELAKEIYLAVEQSRKHLAQFLSWAKDMSSPEDEFVYLKNYCDERWNDENGFAYLIREKQTGRFLGIIDLLHIDEKRKSAEIGYWLCQNATGNGYMTQAVLRLEKEAFAQGFNRIVIRNDTHNLKSANVAKNAGYHLDGVMRQDRWSEDGKCFVDTNIWSKLKEDC